MYIEAMFLYLPIVSTVLILRQKSTSPNVLAACLVMSCGWLVLFAQRFLVLSETTNFSMSLIMHAVYRKFAWPSHPMMVPKTPSNTCT